MFFALEPTRAILSDLNADLMVTYRAVATHHRAVASRLAKLGVSRRQYRAIRKWLPGSETDKAVRLIYLNHTCYAGLYRENKKGEFNVPYGGGERSHERLCRNGVLPRAAAVLRQPGVQLKVGDFEEVITGASKGDVVYCDPTYREVTRKRFDRYGRTIFDWNDQERLAKVATAAFARGALVLLSNGTSARLRRLYPDAAAVRLVRPKGLGVNGKAQLRTEFLFVLDPTQDWATWAGLGRISEPHK